MRSWSFQMVDHFQPFSMVGSFCIPFSLGHCPQVRVYWGPMNREGIGTLWQLKRSCRIITHKTPNYADYATRILFSWQKIWKGNGYKGLCYYICWNVQFLVQFSFLFWLCGAGSSTCIYSQATDKLITITVPQRLMLFSLSSIEHRAAEAVFLCLSHKLWLPSLRHFTEN